MLSSKGGAMHPSNKSAVPILNWPKALRAFLWLSSIWAAIAIVPYLNEFAQEYPNINFSWLIEVTGRAIVPPLLILAASGGLYAVARGIANIWRKWRTPNWARLPANVRRGIARTYIAITVPWVLWFGYRAIDDANHWSRRARVEGDLLLMFSLPLGLVALVAIVVWIAEGFHVQTPQRSTSAASVTEYELLLDRAIGKNQPNNAHVRLEIYSSARSALDSMQFVDKDGLIKNRQALERAISRIERRSPRPISSRGLTFLLMMSMGAPSLWLIDITCMSLFWIARPISLTPTRRSAPY